MESLAPCQLESPDDSGASGIRRRARQALRDLANPLAAYNLLASLVALWYCLAC